MAKRKHTSDLTPWESMARSGGATMAQARIRGERNRPSAATNAELDRLLGQPTRPAAPRQRAQSRSSMTPSESIQASGGHAMAEARIANARNRPSAATNAALDRALAQSPARATETQSMLARVPAAPTPGRPSSQTQTGVHTTGTTPPQRQEADYRTASARAEAATAEAHRVRTPEAYRNASEAHERARSAALNNRAITQQDRELYAASHEGAVTGHARHAREAEAAGGRRPGSALITDVGAQESAPGRVTSVGGQRARDLRARTAPTADVSMGGQRATAPSPTRTASAPQSQEYRDLAERARRVSMGATNAASHEAAEGVHQLAANAATRGSMEQLSHEKAADRHAVAAVALSGRQRSIGADIEQDHQTREQGSLVSRANRASADARTGAQHSAAAQAHREAAAHPATEPHVREDHQRKAAAHAEHAARAHGARPAGAHGHAPDAPHALQKGKKGGSFYVSNTGRKVYTKKS